MYKIEQSYQHAIKLWKEKYYISWQQQQKNKNKITMLETILQRGFWICLDNPIGGILLVGVNPSFDGEKEAKNCSLNECHDFGRCRHWDRWKDNLRDIIKENRVSYIDLFPLRVTKQKHEFERFVPLELKAELLRKTQLEIERLRPRLIIHANTASMFYYGLNHDNPWMGYDLEKKDLPLELKDKGELYIINGLLESEERINYNCLHETSLTDEYNTYIFLCKYQNYLKKEKRLCRQDINLLCEFLGIKRPEIKK